MLAQDSGPPSAPTRTSAPVNETAQIQRQDLPDGLAVGTLAVPLDSTAEQPQTKLPTALPIAPGPESPPAEEIPRSHAPPPPIEQTSSLLPASNLASAAWTQHNQATAPPADAPDNPAVGNADSPNTMSTQPLLTPTPVPAAPAFQLGIDNIRQGRGPVKVAVFTSPDNFPDSQAAAQTLELASLASNLQANLSVSGTCAIAVFQDINGDGVLNKNRFGIPVEPCGFSNNAMINRGPPSFAEAAVRPADASQPTIVRIRLP